MSEQDGGPAFPYGIRETIERPYAETKIIERNEPGMSLRDWFAGQAIIAAATSAALTDDKSASTVAVFAYQIADAMLQARSKKDGTP